MVVKSVQGKGEFVQGMSRGNKYCKLLNIKACPGCPGCPAYFLHHRNRNRKNLSFCNKNVKCFSKVITFYYGHYGHYGQTLIISSL